MRAVNLIPVEDRRGGAGGRSGGPAYILLGALAVLVLVAAAWATTDKTVKDRTTKLARVERDATAAEAKASRLAAYTTFAQLRSNRAQTVASLAGSRFDWAHVMHEIARVIPRGAALTSLSGTVSPGAQAPSGGGAALGLRGSSPGPAIDVVGCTTSQSAVSQMITRLRLIDGVEHVTLAEAAKSDSEGGGGSGGGDCRYNDQVTSFDVLILFAAPAPAPAPAAVPAPAGGAAPAAQTTPPPAAGATPPAGGTG